MRDLADRIQRGDLNGLGSGHITPMGDELLELRRTERLRVDYRVNAVAVEMLSEYSHTVASEHERTRREITDIWGPPQPRVTVTTHYVGRADGRVVADHNTREELCRAMADRHPFVFPPDP